jgi:hypothetical protein
MTTSAVATLQNLPNNKATRLDNISCIYCGGAPDRANPLTDEHVIGRRFVPKGSLATGWSLIARACERCNNEKADLEDDISAITLLPDLGEGHEDETLAALAARKAKGSRSRRTKKLIVDSYEEDKISGKLMQSVDVSFGFVAPPQLDPDRGRRLAYLHLQAFFYLITYDDARRTGGFIPGAIGWLNEASRRDWGNSLQRGFADLTQAWPARVEGTGAAGFFKISIRREPAGAELWSFALEWNRAHRIIGFFGDLDRAQVHIDQIPPLTWQRIDPTRRMRREIALDPQEDRLFAPLVTEPEPAS